MEHPVGYQYLVETASLAVPPLIQPGRMGRVRTVQSDESGLSQSPVMYPEAMWPGERVMDHLRFALQHEGVQPGILLELAKHVDMPAEILSDCQEGVQTYHRRLAYLHEFLTGESTPLSVPASSRYIDVVNSRLQFTLERGDHSLSYRVRDNLLGTPQFCPQVFKTEAILQSVQGDEVEGTDPWGDCPEELQERIEHYLYLHETQASWKIEQETPNTQRVRNFVNLLRRAHQRDFLTEQGFAELQESITGVRTGEGQALWRDDQVWVGYLDRNWQEVVVLLGAQPGSVPSLMEGLAHCHRRILEDRTVPALVHAACISFPCVYIHPFNDGNGRTHRFILHNVLAQRGYMEQDTIFPLSAWLLNHRKAYVASMTPTCQGIIDLAELRWLPEARLEVINDIAPYFRYMDLTREVVSLYHFMNSTVRDELEPSIDFMVKFEEARQRLDEQVNWPYRRISLFIQLCHRNGGILSNRKRKLPDFHHLSDGQLVQLEECVQTAFGLEPTRKSDSGAEFRFS